MMGFLGFLADPLSLLIRPIYMLIEDYGLTLIVVTVLIKLATIPFTIMSQKNLSKTQLIQPELQKLQYKYRNDKNQLSIEMQKLYRKYDVNPLGGCLPLLVQMFILFGFIRVVYDPLTYMLQLSEDQISNLMKIAGVKNASQVAICGDSNVINAIKDLGKTPIDFDFFGIDLTSTLSGNTAEWKMWIFPALAVITTVISSYISKKQTASSSNNSGNEQAQSMSNTMLYIMPIMTAFFTYSMPIGMSLYWAISTIVQLIQQTVITNVINKKVKAQFKK